MIIGGLNRTKEESQYPIVVLANAYDANNQFAIPIDSLMLFSDNISPRVALDTVLFLSTTEKAFIGDGDMACMVVCKDGKAEVVKEIGNAGGEKFYCDTEEHTVTWFSRLSGEGHIEVYNVKDGTLEKITSADHYAAHHYPEKDNADTIYLLDGEEVSEADFNEVWDKYASDANEVTYGKY